MSHNRLSAFCICIGVTLFLAQDLCARGPMVSALGNKHNLSAQNTGVAYHAEDLPNNPGGKQICIFCHTPHNSQPQGPLWNRKSDSIPTNFARYTSSTLRIKNIAASQYAATGDSGGQPNGSSRLCLSCHDGVTRLGDVVRSGQAGEIIMNTYLISGPASFNPSTNKMKVGHHPVSFVYATSFNYNTQSGQKLPELIDADFRLPNSAVPSMEGKVKLQDSKRDGRGWMQCTTCHDPHQNMGNDLDTWPGFTRKMTPFWVYSGATTAIGHDAVCNSCHKVSQTTPDAWK